MITNNIKKSIKLSNIITNIDIELIEWNDYSIDFNFNINNLDVKGVYKLDKFIRYSVNNGILSEDILKELQKELKIIYLDNFNL